MFYKKVAKQFAREIFIACKRNKHPKKSKKYPRSIHDPQKYPKANPCSKNIVKRLQRSEKDPKNGLRNDPKKVSKYPKKKTIIFERVVFFEKEVKYPTKRPRN